MRVLLSLFALLAGLAASAPATAQCLAGDCQNGQGTKRFTTSDSTHADIEATFENGRIRAGAIVIRYSDGGAFRGTYETGSGNLNGVGTMTYGGGASYTGRFSNGDRTGDATYVWSDGYSCRGPFVGDVLSGPAVCADTSGGTYEGAYAQFKRNGRGTYRFANGNAYEGDWVDNLKVGMGTFTWADSTVYVGAFTDDVAEGVGTKTWTDGATYRGTFEDWDPHGTGTMTFPSGNRYEGPYVWEKKEGTGTFTWADGTVYVGQFANDEIRGTGTKTWASGSIHEGEWLDWEPHGPGVRRIADEDGAIQETIEGTWDAGTLHGPAVITLASGAIVRGTYAHGKAQGTFTTTQPDGSVETREFRDGEIVRPPPAAGGPGTITFPDGARYEGDLVGGTPHGQGTITFTSGSRYEGAFVDGQRSGRGVYTWTDGSRYEGAWQAGQRHGLGTMRYADGQVYEGAWAESKRNGQGTLRFPNGNAFAGSFADDAPVAGAYTVAGGAPRPTRWDGTRFVYTDAAPAPSVPQTFAPGCSALVLDLNRGTLNGLAPTATRPQIKAQFPCSTGETQEGGPYNYGGGVFFLNHGFFLYTHRDFLEVRGQFRGRVVPAVLGQPLAAAGLGSPARVDGTAHLFTRPYGCLRVETDDAGAIAEIGIHAAVCTGLQVPR